MSGPSAPTSPASSGAELRVGEPEGPRRSLIGWFIVVVAALALAASALFGLGHVRHHSASSQPEPQSTGAGTAELITLNVDQEAHLRVQPIERRRFASRAFASGRIEYMEELSTPVFSPQEGQLRRFLVKPGERVEQGQPLAEIDSADVLQAESDLLNALPALAKAKSQAEHAQRAADRQKRLVDAEAGALKDYEDAQAELAGALDELRAAEATSGAAREHLKMFGKSDDDLQAIANGRGIDRLAILRAPIAGIVTSRGKVGTGQVVRTDAEAPLLAVADSSTMWFIGDVPEAESTAMRVGLSAEIRVSALPGRVFTATIAQVGDAINAETRRLAIRCEIPNPDGALKAGMFADVQVSGNDGAEALAVPATAVIRGGAAPAVWCATGDHAYARKTIETGTEQDGMLAVAHGLEAGDRVVVEGAVFLDSQMER